VTDERPVRDAEPRMTSAPERNAVEAAPAPPTTRQDADYLGRVVISERVVAKLAAQAVYETPRAGAAAPRVFGSVLPGAGHMGIRASDLAAPPKVNAQIDASVVYVDMAISVRWPDSLSEVTERIRETVEDRIKAWTGLTVARVRISVTDLVADGVS
jgi:uncharacterized alkaline shock family protein YloU